MLSNDKEGFTQCRKQHRQRPDMQRRNHEVTNHNGVGDAPDRERRGDFVDDLHQQQRRHKGWDGHHHECTRQNKEGSLHLQQNPPCSSERPPRMVNQRRFDDHQDDDGDQDDDVHGERDGNECAHGGILSLRLRRCVEKTALPRAELQHLMLYVRIFCTKFCLLLV